MLTQCKHISDSTTSVVSFIKEGRKKKKKSKKKEPVLIFSPPRKSFPARPKTQSSKSRYYEISFIWGLCDETRVVSSPQNRFAVEDDFQLRMTTGQSKRFVY